MQKNMLFCKKNRKIVNLTKGNMRKIVQILVVLVLFASCGGGNKNSESGNMSSVQHEEYENMLASLQRVEILLDDVGEMSVDQIVSLSEFVPQLHYEYDMSGLDSTALAKCHNLKKRTDFVRNKLTIGVHIFFVGRDTQTIENVGCACWHLNSYNTTI